MVSSVASLFMPSCYDLESPSVACCGVSSPLLCIALGNNLPPLLPLSSPSNPGYTSPFHAGGLLLVWDSSGHPPCCLPSPPHPRHAGHPNFLVFSTHSHPSASLSGRCVVTRLADFSLQEDGLRAEHRPSRVGWGGHSRTETQETGGPPRIPWVEKVGGVGGKPLAEGGRWWVPLRDLEHEQRFIKQLSTHLARLPSTFIHCLYSLVFLNN